MTSQSGLPGAGPRGAFALALYRAKAVAPLRWVTVTVHHAGDALQFSAQYIGQHPAPDELAADISLQQCRFLFLLRR